MRTAKQTAAPALPADPTVATAASPLADRLERLPVCGGSDLCVAGQINAGLVLADGAVFGGTGYFVSDLSYTVLEVLRSRSASD